MDITTVIGLTAGILTTYASIPQIIKSWKTKKTNDLSLFMYLTLGIGTVLWLIYGILLKDIPLITANSVSLLFTITLISLKIKYR